MNNRQKFHLLAPFTTYFCLLSFAFVFLLSLEDGIHTTKDKSKSCKLAHLITFVQLRRQKQKTKLFFTKTFLSQLIVTENHKILSHLLTNKKIHANTLFPIGFIPNSSLILKFHKIAQPIKFFKQNLFLDTNKISIKF